MQIFLDTANIEQIGRGLGYGCVTGVTTNPTIISREGLPLTECVRRILTLDDRLTILVEAVSHEKRELVAEAHRLAGPWPGVVVKLPATPAGLGAVRELTAAGVRTAVTLVFSLTQAVAAACAGAAYVAPFVGRLDDIDADGVALIRRMRETFSLHDTTTRILAASLRSPQTVGDLFAAGCHAITMPLSVLEAMVRHPLTESGLAKFDTDWKTVPQGA